MSLHYVGMRLESPEQEAARLRATAARQPPSGDPPFRFPPPLRPLPVRRSDPAWADRVVVVVCVAVLVLLASGTLA